MSIFLNGINVTGSTFLNTLSNASGDILNVDPITGLITKRTPLQVLTDIGAEPVFTKGSIIQGDGMSVTGTLTSRLVGTGNITISHSDTSTLADFVNTNGTIIQSLGFDTYGHVISGTSLDGDTRWTRLIEVLSTSSTWTHIGLQNGIDFTPYTTGSSGYPSTLGFAVAFYANTLDSTSGFGRAFALNREYNTENYYLGSPNTAGTHNGWKLIYHTGNLSLTTLGGVSTTRTLTINGVTQDLSANRTWNVGSVTSVALSLPSIFTVTGSPVTSSGTLTGTLATQTANTVFAAPDGSTGVPSFRTLLANDIPTLDILSKTSGTLSVARGGTGAITLTGIVIGTGTTALTGVTGTASQLLRRNAGNTAYEFFTHDFINQAGARTSISLTTTGTSGVATYTSGTGVLNIPNYTYTHPTLTVRNISLTGATVLATFVSNTEGHITDITTRTLTLSDLGYTGATNANNYVHPAYTTRNITATGAQVLSTFTSDAIGSVSNITTRTLTPADISAININQIGVANGITPLDSGSKIPIIHLPDSILGQVRYIGTWNATTNTPTLPDPTTVKGNYYIVSVDGTFSGKEFNVGDWIISDGTIWDKVDNTDAVSTVFGRIGNILANANDYNGFYVRHDTAAQGLTGTQQTNARTNIDAQVIITGGATTITTSNLTINRALVSDASGKVAISAVTSTELGYVSGVTSSIQTQLNSKLSANQTITLTGDVTGSGATSIATTIANNVVSDTKIRQSVAYSIIGRSSGTTGNVANIVAGADSVLRRSGSGDLLFGTLVTNNIGDTQITYAKIQNVTGDRILGRLSTLGVVEELTATQIRTLINVQEGANLYVHPTYTAQNPTLTGALVLATIVTDTIGSVVSTTTRTLTASDISAVPITRTLTFTTNNGLTGGSSAVDLSINRAFTFGLTGQALALHNLSTNGIIVRTGADTVTSRSLIAGTGISITNNDGVSGNPTISLTNSTFAPDEEYFTYSGSPNFTLAITTPYAVEVYLNGQRLVKTLDWTIAGNVVTVTAPLDTNNPDEIIISYFYNTPDILPSGLTGSGTTNFLTKWSSTSGLTASSISDNGALVSISIPLAISATQATIDTDKFMVLDGTTVKYRTGSQLLSDIGAPTLINHLGDVNINTPTNGQVLQFNGTNWINGNASGGGSGITWNEINTNTNASFDNGYISNSATKLEITLPSNPNVNKSIKVLGKGTGGWRINIPIGSTLSVSGLSITGWIESTDVNDAVEIISTTDGNYLVFIINGNINYNI